jgi:hypothetical protein
MILVWGESWMILYKDKGSDEPLPKKKRLFGLAALIAQPRFDSGHLFSFAKR